MVAEAARFSTLDSAGGSWERTATRGRTGI